MKKKLEILVYHLGYGGIEKAVSSLVEVLKNDYEISILSFYRLYNQPVFVIDSNIPIRYLYETDVPLKVKKYNQLIKKKQIGKLRTGRNWIVVQRLSRLYLLPKRTKLISSTSTDVRVNRQMS